MTKGFGAAWRPALELRNAASRLGDDISGGTAIEYALISGGIAAAIATALSVVGGDLVNTFTAIDNAIKLAASTN
ncbi:MAG TPA: Flp family type IVb pilin [Candidatus Cybelea sp.]|nr:Flp family type IVb pilin [Candidatus Cybelea sp.]